MIKFLVLVLIWGFSLCVAAQSNKEIVISSTQEFIYPDLILFAYSSKPQLYVELSNNRLIVRNPLSVDRAPLQIITLDGKVLNFIVRSISTELHDRTRKKIKIIKEGGKKITKISFTKRYSESYSNQLGQYNRATLLDITNLMINSRINKNTSFLTQLSHSRRAYLDSEFKQFNYFFRLNYFNSYAEYGMMNLRKFTLRDMGGHGGRVIGTRLGYRDRSWSFELFKGKSFYSTPTTFINPPVYDLQGAALFYNFQNQQEFGASFFQNQQTNQSILSFEAINRIKNLKITSNYALHDSPQGGNNSNYSWRAEYTHSKKESLSLRSLSLGNSIYRPGFNNLVFGDYSNFSRDTWQAQGSYNLLALDKQSLIADVDYSQVISDINKNNNYSSGLQYSYDRITAKINYIVSTSENSVTGQLNKYSIIAPQVYFLISPEKAARTQSLHFISNFSESETSDYKNNNTNITYRNSSLSDSHSLTLMRQTSTTSLKTANQYNVGYAYSKIYDNLQLGPSFFYTFSNLRADDTNIYLTDSLGYRFYANYTLKSKHKIGASFSENISYRRDPKIKIQTYLLSYNFNFGADIQTPVAKLFNNRTVKAHFYKDLNFNGKLDKNEKLIPGLKVSILDDFGTTIASKETDTDGFVSFSWLEKGQFRLNVEGEEFFNETDKWLDLDSSSITKEIGLAHTQPIVIKVFDQSSKDFVAGVTGAISFDIKCPNIQYARNVRLDNSVSLNLNIPKEDCTVAPNFLFYKNNFIGIDIEPRKITKRENIFNIKHINQLEIILNIKDKDGNLTPYSGNKIKVKINNQLYSPDQEGLISIDLPSGSHRYDLSEIIIGPYKCVETQNTKDLVLIDGFFVKKQLFYSCTKK